MKNHVWGRLTCDMGRLLLKQNENKNFCQGWVDSQDFRVDIKHEEVDSHMICLDSLCFLMFSESSMPYRSQLPCNMGWLSAPMGQLPLWVGWFPSFVLILSNFVIFQPKFLCFLFYTHIHTNLYVVIHASFHKIRNLEDIKNFSSSSFSLIAFI